MHLEDYATKVNPQPQTAGQRTSIEVCENTHSYSLLSCGNTHFFKSQVTMQGVT